MHYKLLGFSDTGAIRRFSFHRIAIGEPPTRFAVHADTLLARKFNVPLQELPSLCSRALNAEAEDSPGATLVLSEADMSAFAAEHAAIAAEAAAARILRSQRNSAARAAAAAAPPAVSAVPHD